MNMNKNKKIFNPIDIMCFYPAMGIIIVYDDDGSIMNDNLDLPVMIDFGSNTTITKEDKQEGYITPKRKRVSIVIPNAPKKNKQFIL